MLDQPRSVDQSTLTVEEKFSESVNIVLALLFEISPPELRQLMHVLMSYENTATNDGTNISDMIGVAPLAALFTLMVGDSGWSNPEYLKAIQPLLLYFVLEKMSDDVGHMDVDGQNFRYPEQVALFNQAACCELNFPYSEYEQQAKLMIADIPTEAMNTESNLIAQKLAPLVQAFGLELNNSDFFTDPNRMMMEMNLVAVWQLRNAIEGFIQENKAHPAKILAESALAAIQQRYLATYLQLDNQDMPIQDALEMGKLSILTDVFAYQIAASLVHTELKALTAEEVEILGNLIEYTSYIVRMMNDAGTLVCLNESESRSEFELARRELGYELTPRELFQALGQTDSPLLQDAQNIFTRLIKDATEQEYNIVLNSGNHSWNTLENNIDYVAQQFDFYVSEVCLLIEGLQSKFPSICDFYARFLLFNAELYSSFGQDYDRGAEWMTMKSVVSDSPFADLLREFRLR